EELHAVAGTYSFIAKVRVPSTVALDAFLDRLFTLEGVERTETTMALRTNGERPLQLPLDQPRPTALPLQRLQEPGRQAPLLALYEGREIGVEQVGNGVVALAAHRAAVGLHHRQSGAPVVPVAIALHARGHLPIAQVRVRN